jgi:hypothetical protein
MLLLSTERFVGEDNGSLSSALPHAHGCYERNARRQRVSCSYRCMLVESQGDGRRGGAEDSIMQRSLVWRDDAGSSFFTLLGHHRQQPVWTFLGHLGCHLRQSLLSSLCRRCISERRSGHIAHPLIPTRFAVIICTPAPLLLHSALVLSLLILLARILHHHVPRPILCSEGVRG